MVKNLPANVRDGRGAGESLGCKDPLEEEMATRSSILAWRLPRTKEPGGLESMGPQRVGLGSSDLECRHSHFSLYKIVAYN